MPDVINILQSARKKGIKTGLVTNSFKSIVSKALEFHKINGCFDAVVTADDVERVKPYPDPLVKICEKLGIMPQEALYVGDTKTDYKAGKAAGCMVFGLNTNGDFIIIQKIGFNANRTLPRYNSFLFPNLSENRPANGVNKRYVKEGWTTRKWKGYFV